MCGFFLGRKLEEQQKMFIESEERAFKLQKKRIENQKSFCVRCLKGKARKNSKFCDECSPLQKNF